MITAEGDRGIHVIIGKMKWGSVVICYLSAEITTIDKFFGIYFDIAVTNIVNLYVQIAFWINSLYSPMYVVMVA